MLYNGTEKLTNCDEKAGNFLLSGVVQIAEIWGIWIGIGPYTSAAIASIVFNEPCAAVDGNVIRVLSRLRTLSENPKQTTKKLHRLASEILHEERPGDFNQVLISFATVLG